MNLSNSHAVLFFAEPIPCSIPTLPEQARYVNTHPSIEHIDDGSHLEYICGKSRSRQRLLCRQGQILPRLPQCFLGCRLTHGQILFSKTFYRHRERVFFTCKSNDSLPSISNNTLRCINGSLSEEPICRSNIVDTDPDRVPTVCTVPHMLFLRNIAKTTLPSGTSMVTGSSFSYTCIQDYQPVMESAVVECLTDGKLSHYAHCVPFSCKEHPPSISNGRTIFRSTAHGSVAKYRCFPGYHFENSQSAKLTCQFGLWLPEQLPRCLPSNVNVEAGDSACLFM